MPTDRRSLDYVQKELTLASKTTEELLHEIELEKERYARADSFRAVVRSVSEGKLPYILIEVFNNIEDAVIYVDDTLTAQWCNAQGLALAKVISGNPDLDMGGIVGKKCYEVFGLNHPCDNCLAVRAMAERKTLSNRDFEHQAATQIKHLEVIAIPVFNGIRGCFEIVRVPEIVGLRSNDVPLEE